MAENYLTQQEGVAYTESTLPEPITETNYPAEVDSLNGWKEEGEITEEMEDIINKRASTAMHRFFEWLATNKSPSCIHSRVMAAIYIMYPGLLGDVNTLDKIADQHNIDKQSFHHHVKSFRATFNFHKHERTKHARAAMSRAAQAIWDQRKALEREALEADLSQECD